MPKKNATSPVGPDSERYRGHSPMPPGVRAKPLPARFTPNRRIFIEAAADRVNRSASSYVATAAVEQAERELKCTADEWVARNPEHAMRIAARIMEKAKRTKKSRSK